MPGLSTKQKIAIVTCASRVVRGGLWPRVCVEHHHTFADLVGILTSAGGRALPSDPGALERLIPAKGGLNAMALPA